MKTFPKIFICFLAVFLGVFLFLGSKAQAAQGDCHLDWCLVPAPTIYLPPYNTVVSSRPDITGLTWKTTIVKVFLDGTELKNIKQIDHADYYGSFWVKPDFDLKPGRHYIYTIAYSEKPSNYDQSKESLYIYFNVPAAVKKAKPVAAITPNLETIVEENGNDDTATLELTENELEEIPAPSNSNNDVTVRIEQENTAIVEVEAGRIEGGVSVTGQGVPAVAADSIAEKEISTLQQAATYEQIGAELNQGSRGRLFSDKMKRNRVVGIVILAIILLILGVALLIKRLRATEVSVKDDSFDDLPPPPPSSVINDPFLWNIPAEEIIQPAFKPIDVKDLNPKEYWGEASSTAYSQPASPAVEPVATPTDQSKPGV